MIVSAFIRLWATVAQRRLRPHIFAEDVSYSFLANEGKPNSDCDPTPRNSRLWILVPHFSDLVGCQFGAAVAREHSLVIISAHTDNTL